MRWFKATTPEGRWIEARSFVQIDHRVDMVEASKIAKRIFPKVWKAYCKSRTNSPKNQQPEQQPKDS